MVFDKIVELLAEQLDVDKETITAETRIAEDLNADSLDVVEMLMAIEDEIDFQIPDEDIENLKTVGDVADYINSRTE